MADEDNPPNAVASENDLYPLQRQKLLLEIETLKRQFWQRVRDIAPTVTALVAVLSLGFTAYFQTQQLGRVATRDADESFARSLQELGNPNVATRIGASYILSSVGRSHPDKSAQAIQALSDRLERESEDGVSEALILALTRFGLPALSRLVLENRRLQVRVARATGRYIGSRFHEEFKKPMPTNSAEIDLPRLNESSDRLIFDIVRRVVYGRLPLEESTPVGSPDVNVTGSFSMNIAGITEKQKEAFQKERNLAWSFTPDDLTIETRNAADQAAAAAQALWVNSVALASAMRALSQDDSHGANLDGVVLFAADLRGTNLSGVILTNALLYGVDLSGADLSNSNLSGTHFELAPLRKTKFVKATLNGTDFGESIDGATVRVFPPTNQRPQFIHSYEWEEERLLQADFTAANWWDIAERSWQVKKVLEKRFPKK